MARQLHLLPHTEPAARRDWRLDEATRTLGFEGIAQARAVLRAARSASLPTTDATAETTPATRRPAA
jgi:hypothetical protein